MKFAIIFALLSALLVHVSIAYSMYALFYPALSACVMSIAYWLRLPSLVMGKGKNGKVRLMLCAISLPWLAITYAVYVLQYFLSKEDRINEISDGIFIGRYPIVKGSQYFDYVIDLTAEFPSTHSLGRHYLGLPNLDGVRLANVDYPVRYKSGETIFIHCALGHGRSATYCSLLLVKLGLAKSTEDALLLIQKARPKARPSNEQIRQLDVAQQRTQQAPVDNHQLRENNL